MHCVSKRLYVLRNHYSHEIRHPHQMGGLLWRYGENKIHFFLLLRVENLVLENENNGLAYIYIIQYALCIYNT